MMEKKFLVNAYLSDPSGTIKVTLRDRFCDLEERKTYPFDNLLVRGEYKTKDIILVTPKTTRQCHIQLYIEVNATEVTGTLFHESKTC